MAKIKEMYTGFTGLVNVGQFALFIDVDKNGVEFKNKEIADRAEHFNKAVFVGKPFEQKDEIAEIIKNTVKNNEQIIFDIHTNGMIRPVKIGKYKNINYYIELLLKKTNIDFKERINPSVINWFNQMENKYFLFNVNNEDEVDEAKTIALNNGLKKRDIYLLIDTNGNNELEVDKIKGYAKLNSLNIAIDFKKLLWPKDFND